MSGLPEVDPDDWQANTVYSGDGYSEDHPVIKVTVLLGYNTLDWIYFVNQMFCSQQKSM